MERIEVSAFRNIHGAWVVSAIFNDCLVSTVYYGYTKREAVKLFRSELRGKP